MANGNMLHGFTWEMCLTYLDDVLVFTKTCPPKLECLEQFFFHFCNAILKLNSKRYQVARCEVTFLGQWVFMERLNLAMTSYKLFMK